MINNIGIVGEGGAVGINLQKLLKIHPEFNKTLSFSPEGLSSMAGTKWQDAIANILDKNHVVILAVHDSIAEAIMKVKKKNSLETKIIDTSTAYRTDSNWVYGMPELKGQKDKIKDAILVSNPGCHATAAILSSKPLENRGLIGLKDTSIITSITGYSGGGKHMITDYEEKKDVASLQYSIGQTHKHVAEIIQQSGVENIIFQPEVVNYFNGLKTNTFLPLTFEGSKLSQEDFINLYKQYYSGKEFISICKTPENGKISISENNNTQNISIYIKKYSSMLQIIAVIDNMLKGSAGAVVQNLNIMNGLDETMGLVED